MASKAGKAAPGKSASRRSPIYTSKAAELKKRELLQEWGPDTDGAYRTRNRLDGKDKS